MFLATSMKLKLSGKYLKQKDQKLAAKVNKRLTQLSVQTRQAELKADAQAKPRENSTLNSAAPRSDGAGRPAVSIVIKKTGTKDAPQTQLTGQQQVLRKARKFYGRHLPVLACNSCTLSRVCPKFRAGFECAFLPFLHSHSVETTTDLVTYMKDFVGNSMRRAQLMNIIETANGGMPSVETSEALDMAFRQLKELHGVMSERTEESVSIEGDESLIGTIFGGMQAKQLLDATREMKRVDPVVDLPKVEGTEMSSAMPVGDDIAAELVKDAILGQGAARKDLKQPQTQGIEMGSISVS
jgi:hypothetical protein